MKIKGNVAGLGLAEVETRDGRIAAVRALGPEDGEELFLSPGLVDLQVNGFAGIDFCSPDLEPEQAVQVLPALWRTGVTTFCPTLITNSPEALLRGFRVLEQARRLDARFAQAAPCYHLEGPYISPGPSHGTHNTEFIRRPDWDEFSAFQQAANGRIGIVTLAPETPGALDFIRKTVQSGVVVAISHTDGTAADIHAAAECGASFSTHLGNGTPQLIDRHRAPFWAQLADPRLGASIICDSFHLPPELVQVIAHVKGLEHCILVTDAVFVAGLPPGRYSLVGLEIELEPSGRVVNRAAGCLAGSALSLNRGIAVLMQFCSLSLGEALETAATNPARLLCADVRSKWHEGICSRIEPGQAANLALVRSGAGELQVERVILGGKDVLP